MTLWKINCMENVYPGMWHQWLRLQCAAVGGPPALGYRLRGKTRRHSGWQRLRALLPRVRVGDQVIVALQNHRVGRLGEVVRLDIEDHQWDPIVSKSRDLPEGEMGRRILVRWDLTAGPDDRDRVVQLPAKVRFTSGELRPTMLEVRSVSLDRLRNAMNDPANWIGLLSHFGYERALSDYIAAYPHHLEDGLVPYPNEKVRERVFRDRTRLDVLLEDRDKRPVIVECKQGAPTVENVGQIRHYMRLLAKETGAKARGILVHGGARKLTRDVERAAGKRPRIEVVQYQLRVEFARSG